MSCDTWTAPVASPGPERGDESGQRSVQLVLLATVIVLDQATKWWGWRYAPEAIINAGGDLLVESGPGCGTTMRILLPCLASRATSSMLTPALEAKG